jgi:hypothetical protein
MGEALRSFSILFLILFFSSCAKNPVEEVNSAIDVALTHLSNAECKEAIDVLEASGAEDDNAIYLQVLASAYACKSGFNEISFISDDLAGITTTSTAAIFKSLSIMSLSPETVTDSDNYVAIRTGINILLQPELAVPSQVARDAKFGTRKSSDMAIQTLILNIVNLGKFLNFYGNVSATGVKGGGSAANKCFIDYHDPRAQALTGVSTGACLTDVDGHNDLDLSTADGKRRACEGLMLVTNTIDILDNLDLSGSSTFSKLEDISTQVNTIKTAATAAGLGTLINMTSQSVCETHLQTPSQLLDMEYMYALLFETGLQ